MILGVPKHIKSLPKSLLTFPLNSQLAVASGSSSGRVSMLGGGGTALHLWLWHSMGGEDGQTSLGQQGLDAGK